MTPVLEVDGIVKRFPGFTLDSVSFSLPGGCIMGFIGANGAGKTTTIKIIMDLIKPETGTVKVLGRDSQRQGAELRQQIGFVYDENLFYDDLSLHEIRFLLSKVYRGWNDLLFRSYVNKFGLSLTMKVGKLSRGMKTKLSLAAALAHGARLLILDEPSSGLDPIFRRELLEIFSEVIADAETSIFFSTHITSDLEKNTDYIVFLDRGRVVLSMAKDELLESHLLMKGPLDRCDGGLQKASVNVTKKEYGFEALVTVAQFNQFTAAAGLGGLIHEKPSLEDIMFHYTRSRDDGYSHH